MQRAAAVAGLIDDEGLAAAVQRQPSGLITMARVDAVCGNGGSVYVSFSDAAQ